MPDATKRILIVEDEKSIADIMEFNLVREGYEIHTSYDGDDALEKALAENFDLILLDVMLPGRDGMQVLRELRALKATPVVMVTAREEENDKVRGLELGADDYVTKPFSMRELIARVKANIRRQELDHRDGREKDRIEEGVISIDCGSFSVTVRGEEVSLSSKEFELLKHLALSKGQILSREDLMRSVWGYDGYFGDLRSVDVMVRRLREKIEIDPANPSLIITKRGQGYYLNLE